MRLADDPIGGQGIDHWLAYRRIDFLERRGTLLFELGVLGGKWS
ncbi:MAG: hypothetical protein V3V08_21860 [Nannocystaceae bacterium]